MTANKIFRANELPYPPTFQRELAPAWLRYVAALNGVAAPEFRGPFRYLELGCGQGQSALIHAAAYPQGEFHAVDRDTRAIASAREGAHAAAMHNLHFRACAFDDGALRALPRFEFVVLHGVYSWVDTATRGQIRNLLRDLLLPGGLAYVSYNCLPGWAGELPLRRLLGEFANASARDGLIETASRDVGQLRALGFSYFKANPAADRAVASWAGQPEGYLAHEYLAQAWDALWSLDVVDEMAESGLHFIGSATLADNHVELLIDEAAARAIVSLPTERLRRLALDFAVNRGFRRDVFVRAKEAPTTSADAGKLGQVRIASAGDPAAIPQAIDVPRGRVRFSPAFIAELRTLMASGPMPLAHAVEALGGNGETARNLLWLLAGGALVPVGWPVS